MIKAFDYGTKWGWSLALIKKGSMFYDAQMHQLYKEGHYEKKFNSMLNQHRLYKVTHDKTEKDTS